MVKFTAACTYLFHLINKGHKTAAASHQQLIVLQEISSTEKLKFLDEIETVKEEAANLKGQGVDIIIALSHAGLDVDRAVAAAVPDIDVIVGGHSHSFLYTGK